MNSIVLAIFEILIALGIGGFWVYFFLIENKNPDHSAVYFGFERSFPLPDLFWLVPCLIFAAIGLLLIQKFGVVLTIASGGALIFLGLVDISFNARNGGYTTKISDTIMNLFINAVCVIFGPLFIYFGSQIL